MTSFLLGALCLLVVAGSVAALWGLARSNRELVRLHLAKDHAYRQGLDSTNRWIFDALRVHNRELYSLVSSDLGRQVIEKHGLMPFVTDPGSRVRNEIRAVMANLGCTQEEAAQFILASLRNMQAASPQAGSAGRMTEALEPGT